MRRAALLLLPALLLAGVAARPLAATPAALPLAVKVVGNQLVDGGGNPIVLRGANRSGSEYACRTSNATFDGPVDDASISAMAAWHLNTVRVPLNQSCWLGINGPARGGQPYRDDIAAFVQRLAQHGIYAILDLHWSAPGTYLAGGQEPAPDADHAPAFWTSVANAFKDTPSAIFDLYNEPDPVPYSSSYPGGFQAWQTADFRCLRDGGCAVTGREGVPFQVAGTQQLLDQIRAAGARNVVMAGGIQAAATITQYRGDADTAGQFLPHDPAGQLAAAVHVYSGTACADVACWTATYLPVAAKYPVIAGEAGQTDGGSGFITQWAGFAQAHGISSVFWTWDTWASPQALITSYAGAATQPYGQAVRDAVAQAVGTPIPGLVPTQPLSPTIPPALPPSATATITPTATAALSPTATTVLSPPATPLVAEPGLEAAAPQLSAPAASYGVPITASVALYNRSDGPLALAYVTLAARPPGADPAAPTRYDLATFSGPLTIPPGQAIQLAAAHAWSQTDPAGDWLLDVAWAGPDGLRHDGPAVVLPVAAQIAPSATGSPQAATATPVYTTTPNVVKMPAATATARPTATQRPFPNPFSWTCSPTHPVNGKRAFLCIVQ